MRCIHGLFFFGGITIAGCSRVCYSCIVVAKRVPSRAFASFVRSVPGATLHVAVLDAKSTLQSETPSIELRASTTCGGQPLPQVIPSTLRETIWPSIDTSFLSNIPQPTSPRQVTRDRSSVKRMFTSFSGWWWAEDDTRSPSSRKADPHNNPELKLAIARGAVDGLFSRESVVVGSMREADCPGLPAIELADETVLRLLFFELAGSES